MLKRLQKLILCAFLCSAIACSPSYVVRAGWEEAGILLRRQSIDEVLLDPSSDPELRTMLHEVRRARNYAEQLGLQPNQSFRYYSEVDRDVLVWVLSASPRYALNFKTWWFPIVGSVPYKGFFDKEEGLQAVSKLTQQGLDAYLRPSLAFSTLGWFSDPVLSTMQQVDTVSLVDTVFHELLHNTLWLPGHVQFNESLANAVGAFAAQTYFHRYYGPLHPFTTEAKHRWQDELQYSVFLSKVVAELETLYEEISALPAAEKNQRRTAFFQLLNQTWEQHSSEYRSLRYGRQKFEQNNAALLAQTIYLSNLGDFDTIYKTLNSDLPSFIEAMRSLVELSKETESDPFKALSQHKHRLQQELNVE